MKGCRGQLLLKRQPLKLEEFQVLLPFGWGVKEGRVKEERRGPEEMKQ